jgi:hypothetical protein
LYNITAIRGFCIHFYTSNKKKSDQNHIYKQQQVKKKACGSKFVSVFAVKNVFEGATKRERKIIA